MRNLRRHVGFVHGLAIALLGLTSEVSAGADWSAVNSGLNNLDVRALVIDPANNATLYAGTSNGPYKSTDGGATWRLLATSLNNVTALAIDSGNSDIVYMGRTGNAYGCFDRLYKSFDGGLSWSRSLSLDTEFCETIRTVMVGPSNSNALYVILGQSSQFDFPGQYAVKSSDGGFTWSYLGSLRSLNALAIDPLRHDTLYAGTSDSPQLDSSRKGLFKSSDGGMNFSMTGLREMGVSAVTVDPQKPSTVYAATVSEGLNGERFRGLLKSTDGGPSWFPINNGLSELVGTNAIVTSLVISPASPNTLFIGTSGNGVFKSIDGGATWTPFNDGLSSLDIRALALATSSSDAHTLFAGTFGGVFKITEGTANLTLFVPIVLSSAGARGSSYGSEIALVNRSTRHATVEFTYRAALGSGSGVVTDRLEAGSQRIIPDAISYLRQLGMTIAESGNGGTVRALFSGLASPDEAAVVVRTTTPVPGGRAGLAYQGVPPESLLNDVAYLTGLRQNASDRSNVALQNAGESKDGDITLRLTLFSGSVQFSRVLDDVVISPGGLHQIDSILTSNGLSLAEGYVRVERVRGTAPFYAYAVINDQITSDGSFVSPLPESAMLGRTKLTLPVVVETDEFTTEVIATNWSSVRKTLRCNFVANAIGFDSTARFTIELDPQQQLLLPNFVQRLRDYGTPDVGPKGPPFVGALFAEVTSGDLSGIALGARTSAPGSAGGHYGVFYQAVPGGTSSTRSAWVYGLQQTAETRSNLALVNTGETDNSADVFRIELFDGPTGRLAGAFETTLPPRGWTQIGTILARYAPGTTQGYARVTRVSGKNPFIAYAVLNDGAQPGERTGDGAFIAGAP